MANQQPNQTFKGIINRPGFWFILTLFTLITLLHYGGAPQQTIFLSELMTELGLTRHAYERILYLAPIVWAGFLFSWKGTIMASLVALACMLPRALFVSLYRPDAIAETIGVFLLGNVLALSFGSLQKERDYRTQLEDTKTELEANLQTIRENERRLACLHQISETVAQSLELNQILKNAIDSVVEVMRVDFGYAYLLNEEGNGLNLAVDSGLPDDFAEGIDRIKVGEGLSGQVAQTGEPLLVEDASSDPRITRDVVKRYDIGSMLIVPLTSKGKINGTLCVGMRSHRQFQQPEIELLSAIGNQIGVAVENAHLYQKQQEVAGQLRLMQESLRSQLRQVTRAQEEERKRISREIHDDTIQNLVVLSRKIDNLASDDKELSNKIESKLEDLRQHTNNIVRDLRRLSQDLRPAALDRLGLLPALEWLIDQGTQYSGIKTDLEVNGERRRLPEEKELLLFRITQEALRNVWRHSQASNAKVMVEFEPAKMRITISDNGRGFKPPASIGDLAIEGKLGLAGMQERAQLMGGVLKVQSEPGKGSTITVELPA